MRAHWGLTVASGLLSLMVLGPDQAWSQTVLVTLCNDSSVPVQAAIAGNPSPGDNRLVITGWHIVESGGCTNARYVAPGVFYLYAESPMYDMWWWGTDQKFCVDYPGPFNRALVASCPINNSKAFTKLQSGAGQQFTYRFL
jgi:uncharacterized membrane protein